MWRNCIPLQMALQLNSYLTVLTILLTLVNSNAHKQLNNKHLDTVSQLTLIKHVLTWINIY